MMQSWAIKYIRQWRESQGLESLTAQDEHLASLKLLEQKGQELPNKIQLGNQFYYLVNGEYMEIVDNATLRLVETNQTTEWEPHDKREFWCDRLGFFVRLTGDLDVNGFYRVAKLGDGSYRTYQIRGGDLVLKEHAPISAPTTDLLTVNSASWAELKAHICDKFIAVYPWSKQQDKTPTQVRTEMDTLAKSRHKGLAKLIEDEKLSSRGNYEGIENFTMRMNALYESFPWQELAQTLDFSL